MKENKDNIIKTLKISEKTHQKLQEIGNKGQTFDEIINDLADFWIRYKGVVEDEK